MVLNIQLTNLNSLTHLCTSNLPVSHLIIEFSSQKLRYITTLSMVLHTKWAKKSKLMALARFYYGISNNSHVLGPKYVIANRVHSLNISKSSHRRAFTVVLISCSLLKFSLQQWCARTFCRSSHHSFYCLIVPSAQHFWRDIHQISNTPQSTY